MTNEEVRFLIKNTDSWEEMQVIVSYLLNMNEILENALAKTNEIVDDHLEATRTLHESLRD